MNSSTGIGVGGKTKNKQTINLPKTCSKVHTWLSPTKSILPSCKRSVSKCPTAVLWWIPGWVPATMPLSTVLMVLFSSQAVCFKHVQPNCLFDVCLFSLIRTADGANNKKTDDRNEGWALPPGERVPATEPPSHRATEPPSGVPRSGAGTC